MSPILTILAPAAKAAPAPLPTGYGWALLKMVLALALVCVVAYVLLRWGLKKLAGGARGGVARSMRVVDRCPLATGRNLWIVEAAGRYFLLGETEGGISNLAELSASDLPAPAERGPSFLEVLKKRVGLNDGPPSFPAPEAEAASGAGGEGAGADAAERAQT